MPKSDSGALNFRADWGPALVVVLISIPLSMGIAIASGVPPVRGLITAIIGGLVIGRLAGSPLQISGPSAGLAVMVADVVLDHGLQSLGVIVLLMGLLQFTAGLLRLGQMFRAVSPAVINGMLAGIGVLILSAQSHVMVDDVPKASGLKNLLSIPEAIYKGLLSDGQHHDHQAAAMIGLLTLAVLLGVRALPKGPLQKIPPPLAAVTVATVVVSVFDIPVRRVDMPSSILSAIDLPHSGMIDLLFDPALVGSAIALAFVASAETLLCATAVDAMHDGPRTDYDRELVAQGVGNTLCGLVGALPTTGVITRSTANVQAGATSRASALMVGAALLVLLAAFPSVLGLVPRASLAALLVYVGFKLVKGRPYAELKRYGRSELAIFALTVAVIVAVNLLAGIVFGLSLAAGKLVLSQRQKFHRFTIRTEKDKQTQQIHMHLSGAASFIRLPRLAAALELLPDEGEVHLHVEDLEYIDHACLNLLDRWEVDRLKRRAPVRVQWQTLHHRYHSSNTLDRTPLEHADPPPENQRLLDFLTPRRILVDPSFTDKWDAIEQLSKHISHSENQVHFRDLVSTVKFREKEASTCLGQGLMIPHGRLADGRPMTGALAVSKTGWKFDTPDGEPVHCVLLLATPDHQASRHLAVLSAFAHLFSLSPELRDQLIAAESPDEACSLLHEDPSAQIVNYEFEGRKL